MRVAAEHRAAQLNRPPPPESRVGAPPPAGREAVDLLVAAHDGLDAEALLAVAPAGLGVDLAHAGDRAGHRVLVVDDEAVTPSRTTSGTEPSGKAITGVPHASDSTITRPNGSGQRIGMSSARAPR